MRLSGLPLLWLLPLLLSACASGPKFDTAGVDPAVTPRAVAAEPSANTGKTVLWGGVILSTRNLENRTRVEVLAYPLDSSQMPKRDRDPLGRFIVEREGFLEPASYAEGRLLTTLGTLDGTQAGKVGGSDYLYPIVDASELYLWPKDSEYGSNRSNVHFGIGVGIGL